MTASLQTDHMRNGADYYYIYLSYRDPQSQKWKKKKISTGLTVKGNKRRARAMIPDILAEYAYLEEYQPPEKNVLFCDYLRQWMQIKKTEIKTSTFEAYEYRMEKILDYFEPRGYLLKDVTSGMLDQYFRWLLKEGKVSQKDGTRTGLSVRSVRSYKSLLYAAFDQAIIDGILITNPARPVTVHGKRNRDYADEDMFLTKGETEDMLRFLDENENYRRLKPMAFILVYFGLRRSELLGLTWDAIDFEQNLMHIQQTVVRVRSCEVSNLTKTPAGRRDLYLFPLAKTCLQQVRSEQESNRLFFGKGYQNTRNFIFTWEDGRPYDPDYITKRFKKAMTAYGKPSITLHKLRHTCASFLIEQGWDVKQTQYWMGHDDIQTTLDIYAHYNKQRLNATQNDLISISSGVRDLFEPAEVDT